MGVEESICEILGSKYIAGKNRLNAGCGTNKMPGWVNLDGYAHQNPDVVANLDERLPFDDNHFDCIFCSHTLEHVGNTMFTISEFNRILRVGGYLIIVVPYGYGHAGLANPLHKNCFTEETFQYFLKSTYERGNAGQGAHQNMPLGDWRIETIDSIPYPEFIGHPNLPFLANHCFNIIHELRCIMQKVSNES